MHKRYLTQTSLLIAIVALAVFPSCKPSTEGAEKADEASDVKAGTSRGGLAYRLINLKPGDKVHICAETSRLWRLGRDAFRAWASSIGRDKDIKVVRNSKPNCTGTRPKIAKNGSAYITVKLDPNAEVCRSDSRIAGQALVHLHKITVCGAKGASDSSVVYHEMGHLWGLCDQYDTIGGTLGTHNCSHEIDTGNTGLMNDLRKETLQYDDNVGMWLMACKGIAANRAWNKHLKIPANWCKKQPSSEEAGKDFFANLGRNSNAGNYDNVLHEAEADSARISVREAKKAPQVRPLTRVSTGDDVKLKAAIERQVMSWLTSDDGTKVQGAKTIGCGEIACLRTVCVKQGCLQDEYINPKFIVANVVSEDGNERLNLPPGSKFIHFSETEMAEAQTRTAAIFSKAHGSDSGSPRFMWKQNDLAQTISHYGFSEEMAK